MRVQRCALIALAFVVAALAGAPGGDGLAGAAVAAADTGTWRQSTSSYFDAAGRTLDALSSAGPIMAITDWSNRMDADLVVLARGADNASASSAASRPRLALWANKATSRGSDGLFASQWTSATLPSSSSSGVAPVSACALDFCRTGRLDVLVQGADGGMYMMKGTGAGEPPAAPQPLSIVYANTTLRTSTTASTLSAAPFSVALKYPAGPQVAVAILGSAYPSIVYVNAAGELIELRWAGADEDGAAAFLRAHNSSSSSSGSEDDIRDYLYVAHRLVAASAGAGTSGSPQLSTGSREIEPFSLVVADINGDCASELLYTVYDATKRTRVVYAYRAGGGLYSASSDVHGPVQHSALLELVDSTRNGADGLRTYSSRFTVADVDGDGAPDLVFPFTDKNVRDDTTQKSDRAYNGVAVFYGLLESTGTCRPLPDGYETLYSRNASSHTALTVPSCSSSDSALAAQRRAALSLPDSVAAPLLLRAGDYNRDGRVDAVVPSSYGPLVLTATGRRNATAQLSADSAAFSCALLDAVLALSADSPSVGAVTRSNYLSAIPFLAALSADAGQLDVVLSHAPAASSSSSSSSNAVYVNDDLGDRNYFLVVTALNGVAPAATSQTTGAKSAFGLVQAGAAHTLSWEDVRMRTRHARVTQFGATVGNAVQPPRVVVGLGETFSYVRGYTVGVLVDPPTARHRQWPSYLVPNTQVVAVLHPLLHPSDWRLQLYLPTSRYRLLLGLVLLVALIVVGLPILLLRWSEMRADYLDWRRQ